MWPFLARLRERKLAHWAIAYLAGAWLLLQVLDLLAQPFAWPDLVLRAATVLLGVGFLAVLVLAWYHGEKGVQRVSGVELLMLAALLVIAGAAVAFVGGARRGDVAPATSPDLTAPAHPRTAIAVLPFKNLDADGPASFADGLHEELRLQLGKVSALTKVIGRASVMMDEGSTKRLRQIADELGVGSIVEGSVQVQGDQLRVTAHLIDALTEGDLWTEKYERSLDDAFAIQSDIAQQIVAAVGAALTATERTAISAPPTGSPEAYRLYLQGKEYFNRPSHLRANLETAEGLYQRSVNLDSTFALAYAALSEVHGELSWWRYDPSATRLIRQREAAERAQRLAPDLPQAHIAMGLVHYFGPQDWQAALDEFELALKGLPNDAELWAIIGYAHRRLGNWKQMFEALDKVVALDPRNVDALWDLGGGSLNALHRYQEAIRWYSRALELAPDHAFADLDRAWTWTRWQGRLDSVRAALARHPAADMNWLQGLPRYLYWKRKPDSLLTLLSSTPLRVFESQTQYVPTALYAAWAHQLRGDSTAARLAFDSAQSLLDSVMTVLPDDWRVHAARGLTAAGLGRQQEAQREARWLQHSSVYREDAYEGSAVAERRAVILAGIRQVSAAIVEIERMLSGPSDYSVHTLRLDPRWDPIRNDPRFQALLVKYANPQPVH